MEKQIVMQDPFSSNNSRKLHGGARGEAHGIEIRFWYVAGVESSSSTINRKSIFQFYKQPHTYTIIGYLEEMHDFFHSWRAFPDPTFPLESIQ